MTALLVFILFITTGLIVGNQVDKRRFKNKAKEIGLDEWEEDLSGDVRRYERHNNIKSVK